jgi:hypothetical protein
MQVESKRRNKKLDGISHCKTVRRTTPLKASQPSNAAKVRKDIEPTKEKLRNLADRWKGVNKVRGFLTELWKALGIDMTNNSQQNGGNPSRYAAFQLQDGTMLTVTIRASAHNANASTYTNDGNINGDTNISIVLQNRRKKNTFVPHDDVQLSEYVYVDDRIATVESPLSQIALSLVGYLTNGKYVDTTGVAIPHTSPQTNDNNQLNCNLNMNNKKQIRLTESDLKQIVKESVNRVLQEKRHPNDDYFVKDQLKAPFDKLEDAAMELSYLLRGGGRSMGTYGENVAEYAKKMGYTKSFKRLSNALTYVEKAKELISAAKQDMLGEYGNIEEPKYQPHDHLPYE